MRINLLSLFAFLHLIKHSRTQNTRKKSRISSRWFLCSIFLCRLLKFNYFSHSLIWSSAVQMSWNQFWDVQFSFFLFFLISIPSPFSSSINIVECRLTISFRVRNFNKGTFSQDISALGMCNVINIGTFASRDNLFSSCRIPSTSSQKFYKKTTQSLTSWNQFDENSNIPSLCQLSNLIRRANLHSQRDPRKCRLSSFLPQFELMSSE